MKIEFYLRRANILEDTLLNFDSLKSTQINCNLKLSIEFIGEAGIDQGNIIKWNYIDSY